MSSSNMRTTQAISLGLCSLIAATALANDRGIYAGAAFVQTKFEHEWHIVSNARIRNADDEDQGYKLVVGWQPATWFALEASHADLGAASGSANIVCAAAIGFPCPTHLAADVRSTQVAALGLWPLGSFDLFARLGAQRWDADVKFFDSTPALVISRSESDTDLVYGAGAQYRYQRLAFRVEYEHIALGDADADTVSLGVTCSF